MFRRFLDGIGAYEIYDLIFSPRVRKNLFELMYVRYLDLFMNTEFSGNGGRWGHTSQSDAGISQERANDYSPTPRSLIYTLKRFHISETDRIMDMGCGRGLAMYYMSFFPFEIIGGIELSDMLLESAKYNLKKAAEKSWNRFKFVSGDAGKYKHYEYYNYFFIYNSFPRKVIKEVLSSIKESLVFKPRQIVILYLCPEFSGEFRIDNTFVLIEKGQSDETRYGMHIYVNSEYAEHIRAKLKKDV